MITPARPSPNRASVLGSGDAVLLARELQRCDVEQTEQLLRDAVNYSPCTFLRSTSPATVKPRIQIGSSILSVTFESALLAV